MGNLIFCQSVFGESFLTAQKFPATFNDLSFAERMRVEAEGYLPYRIEYDSNGVCISGCAYKGITIKEDMSSVDMANEEIADLIEQSKYYDYPHKNVYLNWCQNGLSNKLPLRYPVDMSDFKYKISSDFGFRTSSPNGQGFHPAIDISCPVGTPVYATADGEVLEVGYQGTPGGAGQYISILHENELITQYLHLGNVLVRKGDKVSACQQIAVSGASGISTQGTGYSPHLDYRIRFNSDKNKYVDILCPCKNTNRITHQSSNSDTDLSCSHSLFNADYKFQQYDPYIDDVKRSSWRVEYKHCMNSNTDLLPDEVK